MPADGTVAGPVTEVTLAHHILQDGEVILRTVKPSAWMIVLDSLPILAVLGFTALAALLARRFGISQGVEETWVLCSIFGGVRLLVSGFRWLGRLYVLTNLRVLRLGGVVHADVADCALDRIREVFVTRTRFHRTLQLGNIDFDIEGNPYADLLWTHCHAPEPLADDIRQAIRQRKRPPNGA
jgi:hypothetical protein